MLTAIVWALGLLLGLALLAAAGLAVFSHLVGRKVETSLPPRGRFTDVGGGRIHWVESGEGPPIVLIHGLGGNHANFLYATSKPLSDRYRVICVDRPGCGYSGRASNEQARIPEQARMLAEFLRQEGIERPLIVGHSLGGAVALTLALNHPDQVAGLALIAPLTAVQDEAPSVFSGIDVPNPLLRRLIGATLAVPMMIRRGAEGLEAVSAPDPAPANFSVRGGGLLSVRPKAFYAAATDLHAVPLDMEALSQRYGELTLPLGILYGDQDQVLTHHVHIDQVRSARSLDELEIVPGAGHMLPMVYPELTDAFIRRMAARAFASG